MKKLNKELQSAILIIVGGTLGSIWGKLASNMGIPLFLRVVIPCVLGISIVIVISYIIKYLKNKKKISNTK